MEILSSIASKLGELLVDATIKQARYLFCFNSIVKELEDKETNLKEAHDGINEKVEEERQKHRAIVVEKDVEKWLADVVKEMDEVQKLKAKIDEKKSCLNGWCPNWGCQYWMDKELPIPRFFSSFKTTELACNQIIEALKKESTKMVGLHGLGGVGKTTLAKFVGNQLRQQKIFDEVGIVNVSQDPDIIKVQSELVKSLGWALNEKDEKDRADRLRLMFSESKSSRILIIFDDVWKRLDLDKKLGIPVDDRDNCCKILLTTRKKSVCDSLCCDIQIPLSTLTPEEGLALLQKNAGIGVNDSALNGVSKKVAGECKGLPLAIEAVGSALRGKGFDEWNVALHKLQDAKLHTIEGIDKDDQDVYGCLKFSYDNLNGEDSKLCFLLCSLFPEDCEIDLEDLVRHAMGMVWCQAESIEEARSLLSGTIKGLKSSSLLLDTGVEGSVKMHDIVRDVALWIGFVEKKFFSKVGIQLAEWDVEEGWEQYRGISLVGNKKGELPSGLVCPNLHILRLENTVYDYQLKVPEQFFEGMPALKVVTIIGGVLSLKSLQFLTNLQVLQLIGCDVSDASFLGKLKRLQILYLEDSPIEIPEELGDELTRLKLLFIDTGSISPKAIKKFPQLEEFCGRIKNWQVEGTSSEESNATLAELNSQLDGSVVCLPKDFTFLKLQRYVISKGKGVDNKIEDGDETRSLIIDNDSPEATSLVIFSTLYENLEFLHLNGVIGYHNIVPSIDQRGLNELTFLFVQNSKDLECIMDASQSPHGKSGNPVMLSRLARLNVRALPKLKWIWKAPAQQVSLQALTKLSLSYCNNLTYIFTLSQARSLMQLRSLEVSGSERLECIVEAKFDHNEGKISVGDGNTMLTLPLLRELALRKLPKLTSFCSENYYSIWPALEELHLVYCPNLTIDITELGANLQCLGEKLRILQVYNCSHLRDMVPALLKHGLKNLEELYILEVGVQVVFQLEAIVADGKENKLFPCLKKLYLEDLRELQVLLYHEGPRHFFSLQNLTDLTVRGCTKLRHLLSSSLARNLLKIEELVIDNCLELEQIIDEDENEDHLQPVCFPKLRMITIHNCPKLKRLFHISIALSLQKLSSLFIYENDELEEVFWHKEGADVMDYNETIMKQLSDLHLVNLPNLTKFWPAGYQIPFPSTYHELVRNSPKLCANSEAENSGAEALQTTGEGDASREKDANEDAREEKDGSDHQ
ncbi:hypothetical protein AB3S75_043032 [Citrus x aurantiifolia]